MSLEFLRSVFENLDKIRNQSLELLQMADNDGKVGYACRQVELKPDGRLKAFIGEIGESYIGKEKKLDKYQSVCEYDGTTNASTIYRLSTTDALISEAYQLLAFVIDHTNQSNNAFDYKSAFIVDGQLTVDIGHCHNPKIKLISMQNPVINLNRKFYYHKGEFIEYTDKMLSLKRTIDVLIVGDMTYFFTMAGEKLFNMERAYKLVCQQKIEEIALANIVNAPDQFSVKAKTGHNPRYFVSFNPERLKALQDRRVRMAIAKQFNIALDEKGDRFDTTNDKMSEKIIKLLCNRGMTDPFNRIAVEVDGARRWQ